MEIYQSVFVAENRNKSVLFHDNTLVSMPGLNENAGLCFPGMIVVGRTENSKLCPTHVAIRENSAGATDYYIIKEIDGIENKKIQSGLNVFP